MCLYFWTEVPFLERSYPSGWRIDRNQVDPTAVPHVDAVRNRTGYNGSDGKYTSQTGHVVGGRLSEDGPVADVETETGVDAYQLRRQFLALKLRHDDDISIAENRATIARKQRAAETGKCDDLSSGRWRLRLVDDVAAVVDVVLDEVVEAGQFVVAVARCAASGSLQGVVEETNLVTSLATDRDLEAGGEAMIRRKIWNVDEVDVIGNNVRVVLKVTAYNRMLQIINIIASNYI